MLDKWILLLSLLTPQIQSKTQEPAVSITVFNNSDCDGFGEQVCLIKVMTGRTVTFRVSIAGNHHPSMIKWYKFYSAQGPQFHSYRRRLTPAANLSPKMTLANSSLALKLFSIDEDDFYPNMFWAEIQAKALPDKQAKIEAYDFTDFQMLNPSHLRYFFVLERMPIELGQFLEGDTITIQLPQYLQVSPSSFVKWTKEPSLMTLFDTNAVVLANGTEGIEIKGVKNSEFGYIRALVYDFTPDVPGRVMVAQRLFFIKKDISKMCNGTRNEKNCHCNPGFEGNGVHCIDIDECVEGMPMKCLPEAECINRYGSYFCRCPHGFKGDGLYSCVAKSIWSPWSPWSVCTVTCGYQNQMRIRLCTHPESGMRCEGPSADLKLCPNLEPCPMNGQWSEWSPWSMCSDTCSGIKKRIRICNSPAPSRGGLPCAGLKEEVTVCNNNKCPVDGMWSPWASWTPCPISCGLGVVSRSRRCNNPAPEHGGKNCTGHGYEEGSCGFPEDFCKYLKRPSESIIPGKLIQ
ncbi:actin-1-like [Platysternon megacephalum]|uniref:Actin-1-like n=1 Tax=Platysternon megacephalum TaxID=55544 RepID=A0A4D9ET61_9SAUR|nr:actin-1-like [Platysternon megacephalum]